MQHFTMFGKYAIWIWACYGLTLGVGLGLVVEAARAPTRARLAARRLRAEATVDDAEALADAQAP